MRGTTILPDAPNGYKGKFEEGYLKAGQTIKPGYLLQRDYSVALSEGRWTYKIYNPGADGARPAGGLWVAHQGLYSITRGLTDDITGGERLFVYHPLPGDDFNLYVKNLSGTADDHAIGEMLMPDDGTGLLVATTGTPEIEPFTLNEAITDPTADTLAWVTFGL